MRNLLWKAAGVAVLLAVGLAPVASATPAAGLLSCTGTETVSFSPPLTITPKPTRVSYAIDLDNCLTGGVTSGNSSGAFTITTSCIVLDLLPPAFSDTYTWNTRASSTADYILPVQTVVNGNLVVTDTGTVSAGLDQGAAANETTVLPEPNLLACATTGVPQIAGPYSLLFG